MLRFKGFPGVFVSALMLAFACAGGNLKAQNNLIVTGDYWTYWQWGFEPDPSWAQPEYFDFDWDYGPSPLGFGEPVIATTLQPGIMTAYFRTYLELPQAPTAPLRVRILRDDGIVLYVNGWEVFRDNLPPGQVDESTPALQGVEAVSYLETSIDSAFFIAGYNVIAAEVHQQTIASGDLVFDLQLSHTSGPPARVVAITEPENNATVGGGTDVAIRAVAGPAEEVASVTFYEGGNVLGTDQESPYETVWRPPQAGDYILRAVALFDDSTSRTSAPVSLTVAGLNRMLRGPYLQIGTPTSVIVKWRTQFPSDSVVRYGLSPGNLDRTAQVGALATDHEVPVTGLSPGTKYYYSIGSAGSTEAGGPGYFFVTSPPGPKPTRIWVIGDSGRSTQAALDVWLAYSNYTAARYTDVWLMLGDNAYELGRDDEYQRGMFDKYHGIQRQTPVWPTIGNHDFDPVYFDIFTLPRNAEAGGVASGVENYYSFDYGDIHFVCLGGYYSGGRLSNEVMCTWLKADLQANTKKWLIAYWHQPPYTKGSHDSDWESDLIEMRENAVPILESYGVDMVLAGHSHCYERSYLLHGHYGFSWELETDMLLNSGSGRADDTGPYVKQTSGAMAEKGTVYVVAGSSGHATFGSVDHEAMYIGYLRMGSLILDIDGDTLQGTFLRENGQIDDYFTLIKGGTVVRIVDLSIEEGTATLSWTSIMGRTYQLEFTSNLAAGWTPAGDPIEATGSVTFAGHVTGGVPRGFYRVIQVD